MINTKIKQTLKITLTVSMLFVLSMQINTSFLSTYYDDQVVIENEEKVVEHTEVSNKATIKIITAFLAFIEPVNKTEVQIYEKPIVKKYIIPVGLRAPSYIL